METLPDPAVLADLEELIQRGPVVKKTRLELTLDPYREQILKAHENGSTFATIQQALTSSAKLKVSIEGVRRYIVSLTAKKTAKPTTKARKRK